MSTPRVRPGGSEVGNAEGPVRVDAALRQTVALLELIRQEEALLGWLNDCVTQLRAVQRARRHLLDVTDAELAEAREGAPHAKDRHQNAESQEAGS